MCNWFTVQRGGNTNKTVDMSIHMSRLWAVGDCCVCLKGCLFLLDCLWPIISTNMHTTTVALAPPCCIDSTLCLGMGFWEQNAKMRKDWELMRMRRVNAKWWRLGHSRGVHVGGNIWPKTMKKR